MFRSAGTLTSIATPHVPNVHNYHSISQLWASTGSGTSLQSVEAGWTVDQEKFSTASPILFAFSTNDGYRTTGCYNDKPSTTGKTCLPSWTLPNAPIVPGTILSTDAAGTGR